MKARRFNGQSVLDQGGFCTDRHLLLLPMRACGMSDGADATIDPAEIGERDAPPIDEKPYKVVFEANKCIGAGKCAQVADNWELDLETGIARPKRYFIDEGELDENVRAAEVCPAKKDRGVIHVIDRRTDEELAPDPHGDGTISVDW